MTSLKAISTSRKRTKRLLTFLIVLFLLLMPLFAEEYRIGLVQEGEIERFSSLIEEAFSFSSKFIGNTELEENHASRVAREKELDRNIAKEKALRTETEYKVPEVKPDESELVGKVINLDLDQVSVEFLSRGDKDAVEYLKYREKLDEIVLVSADLDDGLYEISLSIDGEELVFTLYSELLGGLEKTILPVLLEHYRGENYQLVTVSGNVGANITENGEEVEKFGSYFVLSYGMHDLMFEQTGFGYYSTIVDVNENLEVMEYQLEKQKGERLFISSNPYPDTLFLNGKKLDTLFSEEVGLPFTLTATREGFVPRTVQSAKARESIELQLLPVTFYDKDKLIEEKRSFYSHLLSTLISFGVSVATEQLDRMLPETDLSLVTAGCYGLTTTGVVMMIDSLFDYKNALLRSY